MYFPLLSPPLLLSGPLLPLFIPTFSSLFLPISLFALLLSPPLLRKVELSFLPHFLPFSLPDKLQ